MLWRALKHVPAGFYIDVGANDPLRDSVTRAFYDRGWRGLNVEPVSAHFADLQRDRPRDINLECAVGETEGTTEFWEWETEGLATAARDVIAQHLAEGHTGAPRLVQVRTLASVCAEHAPSEIHFLKIDVEGGEQKVLAGADFARFRPWIVVIEATRPNSTEHIHHQWEHLLTNVDYRFVYADGLNRFYLAAEHEELRLAFSYPPNVFDRFVVAQQFNAEQAVDELKAAVQQLQARVSTLAENLAGANLQLLKLSQQAAEYAARAARVETESKYQLEEAHRTHQALEAHRSELQQLLAARESELEQTRAQIQQVYASTSWTVTAPLRRLGAMMKITTASRIEPALPPAQPPQLATPSGAPVSQVEEKEAAASVPLPPRAKSVFDEMVKAADAARKAQ